MEKVKFNETQMGVVNHVIHGLIENERALIVVPDTKDKAVRIGTDKALITVKSTGASIVKAGKGLAEGLLHGQRTIHSGETVGEYGAADAELIVSNVLKL